MAYKVTLTSGKEVELNTSEHRRMIGRMSRVGKHYPIFELDNGDALFMDRIEFIEDLEKAGRLTIGKMEAEKQAALAAEAAGEEVAEKSQEDLMNEILEKSNCEHADDEQQLFYSDSKMGVRYFTLCKKCGGNRSKFIAASKLTDEEKEGAMLYVEKE